jgi:hypothetical protein
MREHNSGSNCCLLALDGHVLEVCNLWSSILLNMDHIIVGTEVLKINPEHAHLKRLIARESAHVQLSFTKASLMRPHRSLEALLEAQLGEKLNPECFVECLTAKHSELHQS